MTDWPNNPAFRLANGDISRNDYAPGYATRVSRSLALPELDLVVAERRTELTFVEQSTTSGTFVDILTFEMHVPPYAFGGRMYYQPFGRIDSGSAGEYRLRNDTDGVDGSPVLFTDPNVDDVFTFPCWVAMPSNPSPLFPTVFKLQARRTGGAGTLYFTGTDHLGLWFEGS